jgi:hypothetical protein
MDLLTIAISSSIRARCSLPGQVVSFGIAAASVGHHVNSAFAPHDVPAKSRQANRGSKVHPPGTTLTVTGHFGHLIAIAYTAFLNRCRNGSGTARWLLPATYSKTRMNAMGSYLGRAFPKQQRFDSLMMGPTDLMMGPTGFLGPVARRRLKASDDRIRTTVVLTPYRG